MKTSGITYWSNNTHVKNITNNNDYSEYLQHGIVPTGNYENEFIVVNNDLLNQWIMFYENEMINNTVEQNGHKISLGWVLRITDDKFNINEIKDKIRLRKLRNI